MATGEAHEERHPNNHLMKRTLLIVNCLFLVVGQLGGPLILRLYFLYGGKHPWLSSFTETAGFPLLLTPLLISYLHRRHIHTTTTSSSSSSSSKPKPFFLTTPLFLSCAILGVLTGADDYIYAHGLAYLPVSTSTILIATQLAFTAFFGFILVKQKFTPFSLNAVALLSLGAIVLGFHTNADRPAGITNSQYYLGFFLTLGAAALYGLVLPLIELTYRKAKQRITYTLIMEMQFVMGFFATSFSTVGIVANKDFQDIPEEARRYALGEAKYYVVLVCSAVFWQMFFLGAVGVISCASSLLAGVIIAVLIPAVEVLSVVFYGEKFTSEKGLSLALCLWGLVSYYYGEAKESQEKEENSLSCRLLES